jgi:hypothetical protein
MNLVEVHKYTQSGFQVALAHLFMEASVAMMLPWPWGIRINLSAVIFSLLT